MQPEPVLGLDADGCPLWPKTLPAVVTLAVHCGPTGARPLSHAAVVAATPSCASACFSATPGPARALGRALSHVRTWRSVRRKTHLPRAERCQLLGAASELDLVTAQDSWSFLLFCSIFRACLRRGPGKPKKAPPPGRKRPPWPHLPRLATELPCAAKRSASEAGEGSSTLPVAPVAHRQNEQPPRAPDPIVPKTPRVYTVTRE